MYTKLLNIFSTTVMNIEIINVNAVLPAVKYINVTAILDKARLPCKQNFLN